MATLDELRLYLSTPPEDVSHPLRWWYERRLVYPRLYRMALDYLSIPGLFTHSRLWFFIVVLLIVIAHAQQLLLTLSGSSVEAGWFSLRPVAPSLSSPPVHCYVWDPGAYLAWFAMRM
jgi:hypothetical protein